MASFMSRPACSPLPLLGALLTSVACSKAPASAAGDAGPVASSSTSAATPSSTAGGGAPAAAAAGLSKAFTDPCSLLDRSDVQAALGTADFAPTGNAAREPAGDAGCTWHVPHGGGFVEVLIHHPSRAESFDRTATLMKKTPVSGVGDRAYAGKYGWGNLDVLKGGQTFMLQVSAGNIVSGMARTHEQMQASAETLAKKVCGEL